MEQLINKSGLVQTLGFYQLVMMGILKPSDKPDHYANLSHSPLKARLMFMALKKLFLSFVLPFLLLLLLFLLLTHQMVGKSFVLMKKPTIFLAYIKF